MTIVEATKAYETWMTAHVDVVKPDLVFKHEQMAGDRFLFLRATFYRWMQWWPQVCSDLQNAPTVLAVGDLHVENFGTWRDHDGRLIWGVNDFDEAYPLPYTNDLVRLAVTIRMAVKADHLQIDSDEACQNVLDGYGECLRVGGRPFVLAEDHPALRNLAQSGLRDPVTFWEKTRRASRVMVKAPKDALQAIERLLPEPKPVYNMYRRIAGRGSLGKPRYLAIADFRGGLIAREAKMLVASAAAWAAGHRDPIDIHYSGILNSAVRCPDPLFRIDGRWIVRRLAPDCSRIEIGSLTTAKDITRLVRAMGFETANVHLGTPASAKLILRDLSKRPAGWLVEAARKMSKVTRDDWEDWRAGSKPASRNNSSKRDG